jgi:hypothetical protein
LPGPPFGHAAWQVCDVEPHPAPQLVAALMQEADGVHAVSAAESIAAESIPVASFDVASFEVASFDAASEDDASSTAPPSAVVASCPASPSTKNDPKSWVHAIAAPAHHASNAARIGEPSRFMSRRLAVRSW